MLKEFWSAQESFDDVLESKLAEVKQDGIAEGRKLTLFEMAKRMSTKGCSMELISEVTGFSLADIGLKFYNDFCDMSIESTYFKNVSIKLVLINATSLLGSLALALG